MRGYKSIVVILLLLTLTGCWSRYEVQNMNYATAVGIDYLDGRYIIYVQLLDFTTVAKLEVQQKAEQPPVWVGKGEGSSFTEAANDLYSTSQQRLNFGQISAILFSDRLLKENKVGEVLELINRYREIRYLSWLFSTKESIEDILLATPFFRLSPKASILHNPEQNFRQRSILTPIRLQQFILDSNEKSRTSYIPEISIRKGQWKESNKPKELLKYSGIHVYDQDKYFGRMELKELSGMPWLSSHTIRVPIELITEEKLEAVLVAEKPDYKVTPIVKMDKAFFDISVSVKAGINELHTDLSEQEISQMAQNEIEKQIRNTYQTALNKGIDIYNLGQSLYRKHPHQWKRIATGKQYLVLNQDSLHHVNVEVNIVYSGRYKLNDNS
ncbi:MULTISPECIES: Ger(x)C family spore germination protein [unclassified Fredinandcohnia]|uniref:Ger(x)C family spore germination protein n=1 Tax=unclassified Fredinandcohnia TaxID=2837514 RepID=UPI001A9EE3FA